MLRFVIKNGWQLLLCERRNWWKSKRPNEKMCDERRGVDDKRENRWEQIEAERRRWQRGGRRGRVERGQKGDSLEERWTGDGWGGKGERKTGGESLGWEGEMTRGQDKHKLSAHWNRTGSLSSFTPCLQNSSVKNFILSHKSFQTHFRLLLRSPVSYY